MLALKTKVKKGNCWYFLLVSGETILPPSLWVNANKEREHQLNRRIEVAVDTSLGSFDESTQPAVCVLCFPSHINLIPGTFGVSFSRRWLF